MNHQLKGKRALVTGGSRGIGAAIVKRLARYGADVARVVAALLADPGPHLGRIYELTGPRSQDMHEVAREYSDALNREVTYTDIPPEVWKRELNKAGLPEHLTRHLVTMAGLNRAGRYDRMADGVERVTSRPAMSVREFVSLHADEFGGRRS